MRKKILAGVAAVALVAASAAGFRWATAWRWIEVTDDAYVEGDITPMASKVAGMVVEVAVADNQAVEAGAVLVRIDDVDHRARVAEARALVAAREAALAQLDDRVAVQEALVRQAGAGIASAQADFTRTRQDLDRAKALVKDDYLSRQRYDLQAAEAAKAAAGLKGTNAQLAAARAQLAALDSERGVAAAQAEQARAQLAQAQADLDATTIRAPVAGVVGNRAVRVGQYARPGQHLLSVVPLDTVW
ncbi:MAG: efflux RND transporter periplasmic adaptor subunit, partial [Pseudomonadota bacterium]